MSTHLLALMPTATIIAAGVVTIGRWRRELEHFVSTKRSRARVAFAAMLLECCALPAIGAPAALRAAYEAATILMSGAFVSCPAQREKAYMPEHAMKDQHV